MWDPHKATHITAEEVRLEKLNEHDQVSFEEQLKVWALTSDLLGWKLLLLYNPGQVIQLF